MYYTFWNKGNPIFVFCCVLPSMRRYDHLHKYINWCPWVFPTKLSLLRNVRLNLNKSTNRKPVQFNPFLISGYFIASLNRLNCVTSLDDNFHSDSSPDRPGVPEQRAERCHDRQTPWGLPAHAQLCSQWRPRPSRWRPPRRGWPRRWRRPSGRSSRRSSRSGQRWGSTRRGWGRYKTGPARQIPPMMTQYASHEMSTFCQA